MSVGAPPLLSYIFAQLTLFLSPIRFYASLAHRREEIVPHARGRSGCRRRLLPVARPRTESGCNQSAASKRARCPVTARWLFEAVFLWVEESKEDLCLFGQFGVCSL